MAHIACEQLQQDRRIGFIDGSLNIPAVTTDENGQIVMPFYHQIEHLAKDRGRLRQVLNGLQLAPCVGAHFNKRGLWKLTAK